MNTEFFEALAQLEKEKGIPEGYLLEKIKNAIVIAVRRDYGAEENVLVDIDPATGKFAVALRMQVVEEVENPAEQLTLDQAKTYSKRAKIGGTVDIKLETKQFGRIAAQTAKHIIRQGIREAERGMMLEEFQSRQHEIVTGVVSRIDERKGLVSVEIGKFETILPRSEQVQGEVLHEGDRITVYVVDVLGGEKGPKIMISRTHPGLVKRLFEMEVPEIFDGTVEIKAVSREAGSRTKIAVCSDNKDVDAVAPVSGPRACASAKLWMSWAERKSTLSSTATSRRSLLPRPCLPPTLSPCRLRMRSSAPVRSPSRTSSCPWPLATRGRTPALRQS